MILLCCFEGDCISLMGCQMGTVNRQYNNISNLQTCIQLTKFIIIFTINIVVEFLNDELYISRLNILWDYQISREQKLGGGKYT